MTDPLLTALLLAWITACAQTHGVDPHFARAVAICESRPCGGGELEMRVGRLGKSRYYGPFGVANVYGADVNLLNPYINTLIGVAALRGRDKIRVLRRYNTTCTPAYISEVRRVERKLKETGGKCLPKS